ncbi:MAG: four helix bundle protein [Bacteroidota bacterium]
MKRNVIIEKSYAFSVDIVKLGYSLIDKKEFILSKQLIRSATSIGANAEEASGALTKKEFHHRMSISYREARESRYWLRLLRDTNWLSESEAQKYLDSIEEILRILGSILKSLRSDRAAGIK